MSIKIICSDISAKIESGVDKRPGSSFEAQVNKAIIEGYTPFYETITTVASGNVPGKLLCIIMENKED